MAGFETQQSFEQQIENSLTHLDDSISLLVTFVDTFPPEYTEQVLFGEWSLKDMLAHFSGWNLITIEGLKLLAQGQVDHIKPWFPDEEIEAFNAQEVEKRKGMSYQEVYDEFIQTLDELLLAYRNLTTEQWGSQMGPNPTRPIDSIQIDIEHIGETHTEDIMTISNELIKL